MTIQFQAGFWNKYVIVVNNNIFCFNSINFYSNIFCGRQCYPQILNAINHIIAINVRSVIHMHLFSFCCSIIVFIAGIDYFDIMVSNAQSVQINPIICIPCHFLESVLFPIHIACNVTGRIIWSIDISAGRYIVAVVIFCNFIRNYNSDIGNIELYFFRI